MAKIVYLRTDKNGTKYYANYTCPRCGGAGKTLQRYRQYLTVRSLQRRILASMWGR